MTSFTINEEAINRDTKVKNRKSTIVAILMVAMWLLVLTIWLTNQSAKINNLNAAVTQLDKCVTILEKVHLVNKAGEILHATLETSSTATLQDDHGTSRTPILSE